MDASSMNETEHSFKVRVSITQLLTALLGNMPYQKSQSNCIALCSKAEFAEGNKEQDKTPYFNLRCRFSDFFF